MSLNGLFNPFSCKSLHLPNRVVMAPMTRFFAPEGVPEPGVVDYYRRRAEGEVGLIITEGVGVDRPSARNHPKVPAFHGEAALSVWKDVADAVHQARGRIGPQLWHVGSAPDLNDFSVMPFPAESPSALYKPGAPVGVAMTEADIEGAIDAFARAALDAKKLGFDCIEFHAAHGYLFDQFFWSPTNLRDDKYGGDMKGRSRFAVETVKAVRAAVGEDFVLIMRISQWKQQDYGVRVAETPQELEAWITPLADAGIDIFHCSQRRFWDEEFAGSSLNLAGWAKKLTGRATITVGSVGLSGEFMASLMGEVASVPASLDNLLERLDRGEFDLVAVGRALLSDPEWLVKIKEGRLSDLRPFDREDVRRLY